MHAHRQAHTNGLHKWDQYVHKSGVRFFSCWWYEHFWKYPIFRDSACCKQTTIGMMNQANDSKRRTFGDVTKSNEDRGRIGKGNYWRSFITVWRNSIKLWEMRKAVEIIQKEYSPQIVICYLNETELHSVCVCVYVDGGVQHTLIVNGMVSLCGHGKPGVNGFEYGRKSLGAQQTCDAHTLLFYTVNSPQRKRWQQSNDTIALLKTKLSCV